MKRCPYCAEEIQDDAIKCKHCNEWLNRGIDKNSSRDHPEVIQESEIVRSKKDSIANTPKKILKETITPDITECTLKPKKQVKMKIYGWGWLIFFWYAGCFFTRGFFKTRGNVLIRVSCFTVFFVSSCCFRCSIDLLGFVRYVR